MYNDGRPGVGTMDTEDDGTAPRTLPWAQYKKGVDGWYYWQANLSGTDNRFQNATTWGSQTYYDAFLGMYGTNGTTNGNGVLVYPGTDVMNPGDSYGVDGPFASLRLKEWRRGIQDADYLALASQINPTAVQNIINSIIPKAMWENPAPQGDPSWFVGGVSWSADPDIWEAARAQLAQIIAGAPHLAPDTHAHAAIRLPRHPRRRPRSHRAGSHAGSHAHRPHRTGANTRTRNVTPVVAPDPAPTAETEDPAPNPKTRSIEDSR